MNPRLFLADKAMTKALLHPPYPLPSNTEETGSFLGSLKDGGNRDELNQLNQYH